jgi:hypothetical protein
VILAIVLLFGSNSVFAQSTIELPNIIRLLDTVGLPPGFPQTLRFLEHTTCMNHSGTVFRIDLLVQRPDAFHADSSWGSADVNWAHPSAGWSVSAVRRGGTGGFDTVTLSVPYNNLAGGANVVRGGTFRATWTHSDMSIWTSVYIPLRPNATMVDSIYVDFPLCQGIDATFRITSNNRNDSSYFQQFATAMNFHWNVIGANNQSIPDLQKTIQYQSDTTFTIPGFDPAIHRAVTVQRNFCNLALLQQAASTPVRRLELHGDRSVSNPPLSTTTNPREDTLYRLFWTVPMEGGDPRWMSVPMFDADHPACVNYGRMPDENPLRFRPIGPEKDFNITAGYLFFQVGTKMDTMVRYIWDYDTALLQRVYVLESAITESGPISWSSMGGNRWSTLIDDPEIDEETANNFGWFGRSTRAAHRLADSTYRAAFRVRALPEDHPKKRDSIRVSVHPVCFYCENPDDGTPFQNRRLTGNVGPAWDTVKPFNNFSIESIANGPGHLPNFGNPLASDTACAGVPFSFRAVPDDSITFNNLNWWNRDSLRLKFNITDFGAYTSLPDVRVHTETNFVGGAVGVQLTGIASYDGSLGTPVTRFWRTFTPQNHCFVRQTPATPAPVNDTFRLQAVDQPWHQITTFFVRRLAQRPLVIDPTINRALTTSDTIYICRNFIMDSIGEGHQLDAGGNRVRGVNYILAMGGSATNLINANLMKSPPNVENRVTPSNSFHGFFNPFGGDDGNPAGMGWFVEDYMTDDPLQRTRIWIWPGGFSGPDEDEDNYFLFAAQDACGRGEEIRIPFVIIDTISPDPNVKFARSLMAPVVEDLDKVLGATPCENTTLWFQIPDNDDPVRRTFTHWWYPDSWRGSVGTFSPNGENWVNQLALIFGKDPGMLGVNMINRCGGSRRVLSPEIVPIPYYRVEGNWLSVHDEVCQDATYFFTLKNEPQGSMHDLYIQFPNNWMILGNIAGLDLRPPKESKDTIFTSSLTNNPNEVPWRVLVNDSIGNWGDILVRWLNPECDVGTSARPEFWDTTRVFTHTYPLAPLPGYRNEDKWLPNDTVCLRDTIWFSVNPAPKDIIQNNHYIWTFPGAIGEWRVVDWGQRGENSDSVRVVVGPTSKDVDTIFVRAMSSQCDYLMSIIRTETSSTLKMPITTWDTAVFEMSLILDAIRDDNQFGQKPCAGTELVLFVNKPYSVESIEWKWGSTPDDMDNDITSAPHILDNWEFTDVTALPDTFAITPKIGTTSPLFVQMTMFNRCGPSQSSEIKLDVAASIPPGTVLPFLNTCPIILCEGESVLFKVDPIADADQYIWVFPWGRDTILSNEREEVPQSLGEVWVIAINNCSESETDENLVQKCLIAEITPAPRAPIAENFGRGMRDGWLLDTVCLRRQVDGWKIALDPQDIAESGDYDYDGINPSHWGQFQWIQLGGDTLPDIADFFEPTSPGFDELNVRAGVGDIRRYNSQIGVTALRYGCEAPGDTLRIWLTSIDTIPKERLGSIIAELDLIPNPCPGSTVTFRVHRDSAFGYHWILPDTTYKFVPGTDTTGPSVEIIIGRNPAQIGVVTTTGRAVTELCFYQGIDTLWSAEISPVPAPEMDFFIDFTDTICQNALFTATVQHKFGGHFTLPGGSTRWVFPEGWLESGTDTIVEGTFISLIARGNSGKIQVFGRQECEGYNNEGVAIDSTVYVFAMPHIDVVGADPPCVGIEYTYVVTSTNAWVQYDSFGVVPSPSVIFKRNDDTVVAMFGVHGASLRFDFYDISHSRCPDMNVPDYSTTLTAYTTAPLSLSVTGENIVCEGIEYIYTASNTPMSNVREFVWNVPAEWAIDTAISGIQSEILTITFHNPLPNEVNLGAIELMARTHCYADPAMYSFPVLLDTTGPLPILDARKNNQPLFQMACEGDTIELFVRNNPRYTVTWTWNGGNIILEDNDAIVNGWRLLDTNQAKRGDTLALIVPTGATNTLDIAIIVHNNVCLGASKTHTYTLTPSTAIDEAPTFLVAPTETCVGESTNYVLSSTPTNAEAFYWYYYDWSIVIDTVYHSREHDIFVRGLDKIWVVPANGCGIGPASDTVEINKQFSRSNSPTPVNFALDGVFGRDTFCLRGERTLEVEANTLDKDGNVTSFEWFFISGDSITPLSGTGATFTIDADLTTTKFGKGTILGVAALRAECNSRGDTLIIELVMVDTVPLRWLGGSILVDGEAPFCPMGTITLSVADVSAAYSWASPSYHWILPDTTWKIVGDSSTHEIRVIVGTEPGSFSVATVTDVSRDFCGYSSTPLVSEILEIHPRPVIKEIYAHGVYEPGDGICLGIEQLITIHLDSVAPPHADVYHFTLLKRFIGTTNFDTVRDTQPNNELKFTISLEDDWTYDSVFVIAEAIDNHCHIPSLQEVRGFKIFNTPRVLLVGDTLPCLDSTVMYTIQLSDPHVTFDFDFNTPVHSPNVVFDFRPNETKPDTIIASLLDPNEARVTFTFFNIKHGYCTHYRDTIQIYNVVTDTTPEILFRVIPVDTLSCMGDTLMFVAELTGDYDFDVRFAWTLPTSPLTEVHRDWQTIRFSERRDTIVVVAADYINRESREDKDTIRVFASGSCGSTRIPEIAVVQLDSVPSYNIRLRSDIPLDSMPCEGVGLKVWADTSGFNLDIRSIRWVYPDAPQTAGADTVWFNAPRGDFTLYAQFFVAGTCGYSGQNERSSISFNVYNKPAPPEPEQVPFPCKGFGFEMNIAFDFWTDSITWQWGNLQGMEPPAVLTTQAGLPNIQGFPMENDSLHFENVGELPFELIATAHNRCGTTENTIEITPSDSIQPFAGDNFDLFGDLRFCTGNTVEANLKIPLQHANIRPQYNWTLPEDWTFIKDSIVREDTVKLWIIPGTTSGRIYVEAIDLRNCAVNEEGNITVDSSSVLNPTTLFLNVEQTARVVTYGHQETPVVFRIPSDSVGYIQQPDSNQSSGDFDFWWRPDDRLDTVSGVNNAAMLHFAYMTNEMFTVTAIEQSVRFGQLCEVTDTFFLHVMGAYEFDINRPDSVCEGSDFDLKIDHRGGDEVHYEQEWFICRSEVDGNCVDYVRISTDTLFTQTMTPDTTIHYMVVGRNILGDPIFDTVRDTVRFSVKSVPPITANIWRAESIRVIGNRIDVVKEFNPTSDSAIFGEKFRLFGEVEGRPVDYPFFFYEWLTEEDIYGFNPDPNFQFAGFSPIPIDTNVALTGLVFSPQTFYFVVQDIASDGCSDTNRIQIWLREPIRDPKVDFGRIPGAFTPRNNDGINDRFMEGVNEITILNRWGAVIYQATGPKAQEGWDGRDSRSNRIVDKGDYFYIITICYTDKDNEITKHSKTGVVTVL